MHSVHSIQPKNLDLFGSQSSYQVTVTCIMSHPHISHIEGLTSSNQIVEDVARCRVVCAVEELGTTHLIIPLLCTDSTVHEHTQILRIKITYTLY